MIRLSRMADYAVMLMTHFAYQDKGELVSAHYLAENTHLGMATVSKLLKALVKGNLLESARGAQGGYCLSRRPADISMADIIAAVDGPIALTDCAEDAPGDCSLESLCPVRSGWQHINAAIKHALQDVSLQDMVQPTAFPRLDKITPAMTKGH